MKKFFRLFHTHEFGDTDKCRFMVLYGDCSTRIGYDGCHDISIMRISSDTGHRKVGCHTCDDDFAYSLFSQIRFEIRLGKWTDSRLGDCFFSCIISEIVEECD